MRFWLQLSAFDNLALQRELPLAIRGDIRAQRQRQRRRNNHEQV